MDEPTEDIAVGDDIEVTGAEESAGESESVDEGPDILDMLPTDGSEAKEEPTVEVQEETKETTEVEKPTEVDSQPETEEVNNDEMGLEDDLLAGLDEIDEGILAGIESVEEAGKTGGESKSKEAPSDGAVVTDSPPNQDETEGERGGEPTSEEAATDDIGISGADNNPPETAVTEGQGKAQSKEPVRNEDAASVSSGVDIDDILGELDGL